MPFSLVFHCTKVNYCLPSLLFFFLDVVIPYFWKFQTVLKTLKKFQTVLESLAPFSEVSITS